MTSVRGDGTVKFRFFRPDVKAVAVSGDFNESNKDKFAMQPDREQGWWVAEMQLQPGEYRFRYLADGRWFTDFASHGVELKKHGWESVLVVSETRGKARRRSMAA